MLSEPPFSLLSILEQIDDAIDANADLADQMVACASSSFGLPSLDLNSKSKAAAHHLNKARSTIRQLYRDWSVEGALERRACHDPILQDLEREFGSIPDKNAIRVLVPGAGLGRLVFEVCLKGYTVEGNEISWHQLIASNWILNHTNKEKSHRLYPFAAEFSNVTRRDDQLQVVSIPDVHPSTALETASRHSNIPYSDRLSMSIGDFTGIYSTEKSRSSFDTVVTLFFIDTAPNIIRYIETVHNCLRTGGIWINLGPLLWHFDDRAPAEGDDRQSRGTACSSPGIKEPGSIELSNEEVLLLVHKVGFDIEQHEVRCDGTGYTQNRESMLQSTYRPSHWLARKRE